MKHGCIDMKTNADEAHILHVWGHNICTLQASNLANVRKKE